MSGKLRIPKDRPEPVQRTVVIQGPETIPATPQRILWGSTLSYRNHEQFAQPRTEIENIRRNFEILSRNLTSRL